MTRSAADALVVNSNLEQIQRAEISNPPAFGARIAATILGDASLRATWLDSVLEMSKRIATMRQRLSDELRKLSKTSSRTAG